MHLLLAILMVWPFSNVDEPQPELQLLYDQIRIYYKTNLDSAALLAEEAIIKSEVLGDSFGYAQSQYIAGDIAQRQGNTSLAVTYYLDALKSFMPLESAKSLSLQANICLSIGKAYRQHYRIKDAIDFYDKGMGLALEGLDQKAFVKLLHNKAVAYRKAGHPEKANELLMNKLGMIAPDNTTELLYTYNQLGLIHRDLGTYDSAIAYYDKILTIDTASTASLHRGQAYHNLGNIYRQQDKHDKSWQSFNQALEELKPLGSIHDLFITYQEMTRLAMVQDNRTLAIFYAEQGAQFLDRLPKTPDHYDQYHLLANCIGESNPTRALAYANRYYEESSIFNALQEELIAQGKGYKMDLITMAYFNAQRQREEQIRFYWTLFCGLIFLIIAGYFSIRLIKIYRYKSPEAALNLIKNPNEMLFLLDMFRNEKEELKRTRRQEKR